MVRVLFVCLGNICRSPMAEAVFAHHVKTQGLAPHFQIDSAGTGDWHAGERAHPGTLDILRDHGIRYEGRARQIRPDDLLDSDYILAMDQRNLESLQRMKASDADPEIALFLSYANKQGTVRETTVPDPYYDGRFQHVYELVERGSLALLDHLRQRYSI